MYSLGFNRTARLAQYTWSRQDLKNEKKVWVTEALPPNCRDGVHLPLSGNSSQTGGGGRHRIYLILVEGILASFQGPTSGSRGENEVHICV